MNFWNNPEYAPIKALIFSAVIVFGGYFSIMFAGNSTVSQAGSILEATRDTTTLGSGVTTETVVALNKEIERLNNVRTSDAWYIWEPRKKRAEKSIIETIDIRNQTVEELELKSISEISQVMIEEELFIKLSSDAQMKINEVGSESN